MSERRMYWETIDDGLFRAPNYGQYMPRNRHENIIDNLVGDDDDILNFINAFNENCQEALSAGEYLVLDESMVKSYHRNLKGPLAFS